MRYRSTTIVAGVILTGLSLPAAAQMYPAYPSMPMVTGIDCGTPQNALEYYCNNRNQFDSSGRFIGAAPAADVGATGTVVVRQAAPARRSPIDCGNPANATTAYCTNRR